MKSALTTGAVFVFLLVMGCNRLPSDRLFAPQAADLAQPPRVPSPPAPTQLTGQGKDVVVYYGPADPRYRMPDLPGGSPELAVALKGPYRYRPWQTRTVPYADGRVHHMPRWVADPCDDVTAPRPGVFGWSCDDLLAFLYCPARFGANLVALPATIFIHPLCSAAVTDQTAWIVEAEQGAEVHEAGK